jgi:hypothetical protein
LKEPMPDMFDNVRLFGTPMQGLALETRAKNVVRNVVGLEKVTWGQKKKFEDMCAKFHWEVRRPPTGAYNCAGHVWASRRAGLHETADYEMILTDDGYRELDQNETPRPGDLVLYRLVGSGEPIHVGEVIQMRALAGVVGARGIPWVLSKFDSTSGEAMHTVENVPYASQGLQYQYEYRTDRPREGTTT